MAAKSPATATGFGDLLRRILILEKRHRLGDAADALAMTAHAFSRKLRDGGRFRPDEVATLLRAIDDPRLPRWFFAGTGLLLVSHAKAPPGAGGMTLHQRAAASAADAIKAVFELADTLELSMLEPRQETIIEQHLDQAQAGLLSIQLQLAPTPQPAAAPPAGDAPGEFAGLLRARLEETGLRPHDLAGLLGLSYHALHARLSGHVAFLPAELRHLFLALPDPRLADYLLAGTAFTPIPRPAVTDDATGRSSIRTGLLSLREIMQFLDALLHAGEAASVPPAAVRHLDEAARQVAALRWNMTHIGRHDRTRDPRPAAGGFSLAAPQSTATAR